MIPEGWEQRRWGDIATIEYGKSLRDYADANGRFRVFGTNGPIGWHEEPLYEQAGVIIGRKGAYRGIHYSPEPFFVIDTAFYLKPKQPLDMRWAYYQLLTQDINSLDSGSAIPSTSREDFYSLPVLVPPLEEQEEISSTLGTLDDKIDLNRRTSNALEAVARALFQSWFVDFDPVRAKANGEQPWGMDEATAALFPDSFDHSELGEIPTGWRVEPIGEVTRVYGGSTPRTTEPRFWNGDISFATPKDLSRLAHPVLLSTERRITPDGLATISSGLLPPGTVLLSSRAPVGYLAISEVPVAVNQGFAAIVGDSTLPNHYVLQWCRENMDTIKSRANGTTFQEISKSAFRSLPAIVPTEPILDAYVQQVEPLHRRLVANMRESLILGALRDALLPRLLSGEVRVKGAEAD